MASATASGSVRIFRPGLFIRALVGAAGLFWLSMLGILFWLGTATLHTLLSVLFFVGFFCVSVAYCSAQSIEVDPCGITHRLLRSHRRLGFEEVLRVHVLPGLPVTVYSVITRSGIVLFTSLFKGHRELFELIVERARLSR
jgi:hypothetical protein